jgi:hypothetical protein
MIPLSSSRRRGADEADLDELSPLKMQRVVGAYEYSPPQNNSYSSNRTMGGFPMGGHMDNLTSLSKDRASLSAVSSSSSGQDSLSISKPTTNNLEMSTKFSSPSRPTLQTFIDRIDPIDEIQDNNNSTSEQVDNEFPKFDRTSRRAIQSSTSFTVCLTALVIITSVAVFAWVVESAAISIFLGWGIAIILTM